MPGIARNLIVAGPAMLQHGAGPIQWSKGDITIKPVLTTFPIETALYGQVDTRLRGKLYEVTYEPDGRLHATRMTTAALWPWAATAVGTSLFGSSDTALVIQGADGTRVTLHNAAMTQMPSIRMGASVTVAGTVKYTALLKLNTEPTDAAAYLTAATTGAALAQTNWETGDILTQATAATWGSAPWAGFHVDSPGWEITPVMNLQAISVDSYGVVDMVLQGLKVTAKAIPVGITAAQLVAAMNPTGAIGSSMGAGTELVITAGTTPKLLTVTVYNAAMIDSALVYSASKKRVAQCTWEACRTVTTGAADPLFSIALS